MTGSSSPCAVGSSSASSAKPRLRIFTWRTKPIITITGARYSRLAATEVTQAIIAADRTWRCRVLDETSDQVHGRAVEGELLDLACGSWLLGVVEVTRHSPQ